MTAIFEMELNSTQLQAIAQIFRLLHHRNKNQHRHSKWWKWFSLLKRCVISLIREVEGRDSFRVQARLRFINLVLLPRCYEPFTQLIYDTQFSTLGLTLLAELSKIRGLMGPCSGGAKENIDPVAESMDSRCILPLDVAEDVGEAMARTKLSDPADVSTHRALAFDVVTRPERGRDEEMRLHESEGTGQDGAANVRTELLLRAGASMMDLDSYASLVPVKRHKQKALVNAIDDLFQGLD